MSEWKHSHFFKLQVTSVAHPGIRQLQHPLTIRVVAFTPTITEKFLFPTTWLLKKVNAVPIHFIVGHNTCVVIRFFSQNS